MGSLSFLIVAAIAIASAAAKAPLRYKVDEAPQDDAINNLMRRVLGNRASEFGVTIKPSLSTKYNLPSASYHIGIIENGVGNQIWITANSGVAAAWTLNWYLKRYGKCHISWDERQLDSLPSPLPAVPRSGLVVKSRYEHIFMGNPCVYSYTMAFWNFTEWEPFIDWLALSGVNLIVMPVGYESVLYNMYHDMGLSDSELDEFFVGPAYHAWFEMGNIRNLAGPLSAGYFATRLRLGRQILQRLLDLDIEPVLPGFNGLVPPQLSRVLPHNTSFIYMHWSNFGPDQSQSFLSVLNQTTLYSSILLNYLEHAAEAFGPTLFSGVRTFLIDSFNEMGVPINTVEFITTYSLVVSTTLRAYRPDALWMVQGWMFVDGNWDALHVHALLDPVPRGSMIVLDMYAESSPIYLVYPNFYGHRFIWCMLHSFGGVNGWFGQLDSVVPGPQLALGRPELAGIGVSMEGFYHNYVLYELMLENAYPDSPIGAVSDWTSWLSTFAERRYGAVPYNSSNFTSMINGWNLAATSAYTVKGGGGQIIQNNDPYLNFMKNRPTSTFGIGVGSPSPGPHRFPKNPPVDQPYNRRAADAYLDQLFTAWKQFLIVPSYMTKRSSYQHDLVDLSRQCLSVLARNRFDTLRSEFLNVTAPNRYQRVQNAGNAVLEVMESFDELLGSHSAFLTGTWVAQASRWSSLLNTTNQARLGEYNAQSQLATWADSYCCLDYAGKQWNGLFATYYVPRHQLFLEALLSAVLRGRMWSHDDSDAYGNWVSEVIELPFGYANYQFSTEPTGDPFEISQRLYQRFSSSI